MPERVPAIPGQCFAGETFIIEYEPDTVGPQSQLVMPSRGEVFAVGTPITVAWTASDPFGFLDSIDIELSRTGPSGPFVPLAFGLPPGSTSAPMLTTTTGMASSQVTGSYTWVPCEPAESIMLRITVWDKAGNQGSGLSDGTFAIEGVNECPTRVTSTSWGRLKSYYR